jgi:hypothetical protein
VSHLLAELVLRLGKVLGASVLGLGIYLVIVGPLGGSPSLTLALLSWLAGAAFVLLIESSPI